MYPGNSKLDQRAMSHRRTLMYGDSFKCRKFLSIPLLMFANAALRIVLRAMTHRTHSSLIRDDHQPRVGKLTWTVVSAVRHYNHAKSGLLALLGGQTVPSLGRFCSCEQAQGKGSAFFEGLVRSMKSPAVSRVMWDMKERGFQTEAK